MTTALHSSQDSDKRVALSVCIPTYNRADYIANAILSVTEQAGPETVEIVVCDNHSTDATETIVAELAKNFPNIRYVKHEVNLGFDRNLLGLVNYSTGEYVWALGSDDTLAPGAINELLQVINDGNPDLIFADAVDCDLNLNKTGYLKFLNGNSRDFSFESKKDILDFLDSTTMTASLFGYISSMLIKRDALNKVPVSRYTIGSAYSHVFRALDVMFRANGKFHYLAKPIVNNRRNNCSYVAEFGEMPRYLIDLRMFRVVIDDYFSTDLEIHNCFKKFVRNCFGRMAYEKVRTGIVVFDELLEYFEEDDAVMPEINLWERRLPVERAYRRFQENGILQRCFSGNVILHIGYRQQGKATLKPINERAVGLESGYAGYDKIHLPFESASQDTVYVSDHFPLIDDPVETVREWFRVLRVGGSLIITNRLHANSGQGTNVTISSILALIEMAMPVKSNQIFHCTQSFHNLNEKDVTEVDIAFYKIDGIGVDASQTQFASSSEVTSSNDQLQKTNVTEMIKHALRLHAENVPAQAVWLCEEILMLDAKNATALQLLGLIAYQSGNHVEAICRISEALSINSSLLEAYSNIGCAYAALGGNDEAMKCFEAALNLRPDFVSAKNNLAILRANTTQHAKARENFLSVLAAHPQLQAVHAGLDGIVIKNNGYRSDPNYLANDDILRCFADRMDLSGDDSMLLKRILTAYQKASHDLLRCSEVFRPSNLWLPIYKYNLRAVIAALESEDFTQLDSIYRNFWRDPCSTGLVGVPVDMQSAFFSGDISYQHKHLFLNDAIHRYNLWEKLLNKQYPIESLHSPIIGNPYGYFIDNQFIKAGADYQHYYSTRIIDLLKDVRAQKVVAEIGGGFGGMAHYVIRDSKNTTYVDFDLPENLALTSYYLLKAFPEKKVLLYGEAELDSATLKNYDIVLMPSFQLDALQDNSCDLIFNSYSLAEMSPETIRHYVWRASKLIKDNGWFFHVNHTKVSLVSARDFPIPETFSLKSEEFAAWNLGRNQNMDEYEFVYRKDKS